MFCLRNAQNQAVIADSIDVFVSQIPLNVGASDTIIEVRHIARARVCARELTHAAALRGGADVPRQPPPAGDGVRVDHSRLVQRGARPAPLCGWRLKFSHPPRFSDALIGCTVPVVLP